MMPYLFSSLFVTQTLRPSLLFVACCANLCHALACVRACAHDFKSGFAMNLLLATKTLQYICAIVRTKLS